MKNKLWVAISIFGVLLEIILFNSTIGSYLELIIVFTWAWFFYADITFSFFFIIIGGFFLELFTFRDIGFYSISFSISILVLFILKNYLNLIDEEKKYSMSIIGFTINIFVYYLIYFLTKHRLNYFSFFLGVLLSSIIFISLMRFVRERKIHES